MLMDMKPWFIISMRIIIISGVFLIWEQTKSNRLLINVGYMLISTGAISNLADQFLYGHVIDYIMIHTQTWSFAVFNLADAYITLGACSIAFDEFLAIYNKMNSS
ncbi:Lipoprotein signal peptidase [Liberibacter crescens BT-1]|uniref:Lipoprotein signal peptidase n=2 Tax=Liberibacter crescens TaxID=1273132 RepID=L0EXA8_LIBCB|nr:Lipoprotein signal peptidase [Liberibacter crescens BT-1]